MTAPMEAHDRRVGRNAVLERVGWIVAVAVMFTLFAFLGSIPRG